MKNRPGLIIQALYHAFRSALPLTLCLLLAGCAILGKTSSKPVPMGEVRFHIQEGDRYLNEGNYDKALESYNAAIQLHPESIEARRKLAEARANYGEPDLALEEFGEILKIDPNYIHAYNYRGFIYNKQEKWAEAAKEFEAAVKLDANNLYSIGHLGLMYRMMGRLEDARDILEKGIELDPEMDDPDSKDVHNFLGLVYQDEGDYEKAIAEFRKTLEHFPADATTYSYLGTALENAGRYQEAANAYSEALKLDPEDTFCSSRLQALQQAGAAFPEVPPVEIVKDDPESHISTAPDASEYPNAGAIILLDKLSYEITDEGTARYTVHQIVKLLNNRGSEEFGEIAMPYDAGEQGICINVARTILPDGTEIDASPDAFHDITPPGISEYNLYSDIMYRVVSMPALQPGVVLEYQATIEDTQPSAEMSWILGGMAFQWIEPILASKCVLRVPKDVEIKWKLYNCEFDPVITEDNSGHLTYIWIYRDSPEFVPEAAMPPMEELIPRLIFSTAESWDDVNKWYRELAEPQEVPDKAIKRKVAELIAGKATDEEKVKAIFGFVASEVRYVAIELGLGAYRPYPATDVFKNRYGDCKDKVTLLITMLREAGIEAHPVLISPAPHKRVDVEIPSVGQFSHVIAVVPLGDDYVWLDPSVATCGYSDLPAGDQGRKAFVIRKDGGEFLDTPVFPPETNKIVSASEITLMEDGTIRGWERTTATGQADMYLRAIYRLARPDRIKGMLENILNQRYPGMQIEDASVSDLYDLDAPLEIKVDFFCPNYASDLEGRLIFPLASEDFSIYAGLVGSVERRYDFHLGYSMAMEKVLTLTLPDGYETTSMPSDISIEHEFGRFARRYEEISDSAVRYSVSLEMDIPVIPAANYTGFKKLMETAAREDMAQIILKKSRAAVGIRP